MNAARLAASRGVLRLYGFTEGAVVQSTRN